MVVSYNSKAVFFSHFTYLLRIYFAINCTVQKLIFLTQKFFLETGERKEYRNKLPSLKIAPVTPPPPQVGTAKLSTVEAGCFASAQVVVPNIQQISCLDISFLECSLPTREARVRSPAGTCQSRDL